MTTKRYESLDGMRGICALIVALLHFDFVLGTGIFGHGWLSVDIFFVLSGFVITLVYEERLRNGNAFLIFLRARAARLIPVQIVGTVACAVAVVILHQTSGLPATTLSTIGLGLFCGLLPLPISFAINPPLWSLQGEWIANFIYGGFLFAARTRALLSIIAVLVTYLVYCAGLRGSWNTAGPFEFFPSLARAIAGFLAGVVLHRAHAANRLQNLPSVNPVAIYGAWLCICFAPLSWQTSIFEMVAALIVAPLAVALLVRNEAPASKVYLMLGQISYPLYVSHFAVITLYRIWLHPGSTRNPAILLPMLMSAFLLAWIIGRLGKPLSAWMAGRRERRMEHELRATPLFSAYRRGG